MCTPIQSAIAGGDHVIANMVPEGRLVNRPMGGAQFSQEVAVGSADSMTVQCDSGGERWKPPCHFLHILQESCHLLTNHDTPPQCVTMSKALTSNMYLFFLWQV